MNQPNRRGYVLIAQSVQIATITTPMVASPVQESLRISELHYNPSGSDDTEFIELNNISDTVTLDLTGVRLTDGPSSPFDFTTSGVGEEDWPAEADGQGFSLVIADANASQSFYAEGVGQHSPGWRGFAADPGLRCLTPLGY